MYRYTDSHTCVKSEDVLGLNLTENRSSLEQFGFHSGKWSLYPGRRAAEHSGRWNMARDCYLNLHNVWYGRLMQGNNSRIFLHSVSTDRIWHSISPGAKGVPNSSIFSVFWSWQRFKLVSFLHPDRCWPSRFLPFQNHSGKLVSQS